MKKSKTAAPNWIDNLRTLMDQQGLNPRSLSLKAGLNPTAVRDMLEGRTRFPRYDTVQTLAEALQTSPARLMEANDIMAKPVDSAGGDAAKLDLLTEIIARLQEVIDELRQPLSPGDFAAIATVIYRQMQDVPAKKVLLASIKPKIHDLLEYERLRQRKVG